MGRERVGERWVVSEAEVCGSVWTSERFMRGRSRCELTFEYEIYRSEADGFDKAEDASLSVPSSTHPCCQSHTHYPSTPTEKAFFLSSLLPNPVNAITLALLWMTW